MKPALISPPARALRDGDWHTETDGLRTICRFYDGHGVLQGFGMAPQEAGVRQQLLAEMGRKRAPKDGVSHGPIHSEIPYALPPALA